MKLRTIPELQAAYGWTIPLRSIDTWRPLFPAHGFLRGIAAHHEDVFWLDAQERICWFTEFSDALLRVQILATDGVLALFSRDYCDTVFTGHLANFVGPVGKEEIHEADWDFIRNARKVKVFRRKPPQPPAIIPVDTFKTEYFEAGHSRLDEIEKQVFVGIGRREIEPQDFDVTVARLREAAAASKKPASPKSSKHKQDFDRILALI